MLAFFGGRGSRHLRPTVGYIKMIQGFYRDDIGILPGVHRDAAEKASSLLQVTHRATRGRAT